MTTGSAARTTTVQHPRYTDGGPASRHNPVEEDTEQLAMSTLSFQDYVRERMLRRRHEAMNGPSTPPTFAERSRDQDRDFPASALLPLPWCATTRCAPSHGPARARATAQGRARSGRHLHGPAAKPDERAARHEGDD